MARFGICGPNWEGRDGPGQDSSTTLVCFGATSAIVTSVGLVVGFGSADVPKSAIISCLLIVGLADNLTDTLSIHIFQESVQRSARPSAIF
jgi:hypothetical protein